MSTTEGKTHIWSVLGLLYCDLTEQIGFDLDVFTLQGQCSTDSQQAEKNKGECC